MALCQIWALWSSHMCDFFFSNMLKHAWILINTLNLTSKHLLNCTSVQHHRLFPLNSYTHGCFFSHLHFISDRKKQQQQKKKTGKIYSKMFGTLPKIRARKMKKIYNGIMLQFKKKAHICSTNGTENNRKHLFNTIKWKMKEITHADVVPPDLMLYLRKTTHKSLKNKEMFFSLD